MQNKCLLIATRTSRIQNWHGYNYALPLFYKLDEGNSTP